MGVYYHCQKCGAGLDKPTASFDLDRYGMRQCPSCGKDPGQYETIQEWICDIDERLRELEQKKEG